MQTSPGEPKLMRWERLGEMLERCYASDDSALRPGVSANGLITQGASTLNCTHISPGYISLPISLLMLVVRKASNSVRGPVFYYLLLSCASHYGHMADSVASCAARPGLRGSSGWQLAASNTRTGDPFRRPIRCCCYRWRFVGALYRVLKLERFCCRTWWIRGCH
jgi:hypothetical protein